MLFAVDRHIAFHPGKDASFEIRRMELRIRLEMEKEVASLFARRGPDECIGKDLEKFGGLLVIMLTAFALAGLRMRITHEGAHLLALLIFWKRLSIALDHAIQTHQPAPGQPTVSQSCWVAGRFRNTANGSGRHGWHLVLSVQLV